MRLPDSFLQKVKIVLHAIQGFVIFLAWAITIAIFTKDGTTDGRTKFFFALCWFCIPLLVYQTAVPQFNRTKRFSNAYAHAAIDILLAVFWFAAFISVATWTSEGIRKGVGRPGTKGCDAFAWGGGGGKCHLSQATIGMGVVIFLLFIATSIISVRNLLYYRRNGSLPGATPDRGAISHPLPLHDEDDQAKYAFSSNPHDEFDEHDDEEAASGAHGARPNYEVLHNADDTLHPGGAPPWQNQHIPSTANLGRYDEDTSYHPQTSSSGAPQLPPHRDPFRDRSPSPYRVHNPPASELAGGEDTGYHGRYDRPEEIGQGLGQGQAGDPFGDDLALSHDHGGYAGRGGGRVDFPQGDYHRT
ncbi:MAG: hypothetical protein Q9201_005221 [Fulgogasparrea decipioides]